MPSPLEQDPLLLDGAMRRALELAARGPAADTNPQVGCVILSPDGQVLAEGWHRGRGTPHAETDALSHLTAEQTRGATAIVTLEPCNHLGRTGPCSEALIAAGVSRVAFAVHDPNPAAKDGAARLREAGVEVIAGILEPQVSELLRPWLTAMRNGRPHVTLKWASSLDGRAAANDGSSQWITGPAARAHVHEQRAAADVIIVGTGTVIADDPSLTARDANGGLLPHQPRPVVIGERPIPATARIREHPHPLLALETHDLDAALRELFRLGYRRAFVEGGPTLASALIAQDLVDEHLIYLAPILLGGSGLALHDLAVGSIAEARRLEVARLDNFGADLLVTARPRAGGANEHAPHSEPRTARPSLTKEGR